MSIHLDAATEALLERLARQRGCSESEVLREAVRRMAEERFSSCKGAKLRAYKRSRSKLRKAYRELAK